MSQVVLVQKGEVKEGQGPLLSKWQSQDWNPAGSDHRAGVPRMAVFTGRNRHLGRVGG